MVRLSPTFVIKNQCLFLWRKVPIFLLELVRLFELLLSSNDIRQSDTGREIQTKIKNALYSDPVVKGTQVQVQSLNGEVQLSGFVDNELACDRAVQIASRTPGVVRVYNNLIMPTGR